MTTETVTDTVPFDDVAAPPVERSLLPLTPEPAFNGYYRCSIIAWACELMDSGAVSVSLKLLILEGWDATHKAWESWDGVASQDGTPLGYTLDARSFIIKKDGSTNDSAFAQVKRAIKWNGDFLVFDADPPAELRIVAQTEWEEYEGKPRQRVAWINPGDFNPGDGFLRAANTEQLKDLNARFGAAMRAMAATK